LRCGVHPASLGKSQEQVAPLLLEKAIFRVRLSKRFFDKECQCSAHCIGDVLHLKHADHSEAIHKSAHKTKRQKRVHVLAPQDSIVTAKVNPKRQNLSKPCCGSEQGYLVLAGPAQESKLQRLSAGKNNYGRVVFTFNNPPCNTKKSHFVR